MSRFGDKVIFAAFIAATFVLVANHATSAQQKQNKDSRKGVEVVRHDAEKRVDIFVEGRPFTSYLFADTIAVLKKTVLYPLRTAQGTIVTRGFPLAPRAGERVDHPHQIGCWFNYGDVNGLDFWNNSNAIPPERAHEMGTIRHRAINHIESGANSGVLEVTADWLEPEGNPILREDTRFVFHAGPNLRAIDFIRRDHLRTDGRKISRVYFQGKIIRSGHAPTSDFP